MTSWSMPETMCKNISHLISLQRYVSTPVVGHRCLHMAECTYLKSTVKLYQCANASLVLRILRGALVWMLLEQKPALIS
jgi:hypothetical protein